MIERKKYYRRQVITSKFNKTGRWCPVYTEDICIQPNKWSVHRSISASVPAFRMPEIPAIHRWLCIYDDVQNKRQMLLMPSSSSSSSSSSSILYYYATCDLWVPDTACAWDRLAWGSHCQVTHRSQLGLFAITSQLEEFINSGFWSKRGNSYTVTSILIMELTILIAINHDPRPISS